MNRPGSKAAVDDAPFTQGARAGFKLGLEIQGLEPPSELDGPVGRAECANAIGADLEIAREALMSAAKKCEAANVPAPVHADVLFAMDNVRDLTARIAEFAGVES